MAVLCHIVGMNGIIKDDFTNIVNSNYPNIVIKDIDVITNEIRNNKQMVEYDRKINSNRIGTVNKNSIIKEMHSFWQSTIDTKLQNIIKRHSGKQIIFLGLCSYHRNHKLKTKIDTFNKFFVKIECKKNAKNIVEYNIDKYRKHLIGGSFPLRYIDHEFLIKQRERLVNVYSNMNYKMKSYDNIKKWLELKLQDDAIIIAPVDDLIYVTSKTNYNNGTIDIESLNEEQVLNQNVKKSFRKSKSSVIDFLYNDEPNNLSKDNSKRIVGYTKKWLSLLSVVPDHKTFVKKGLAGYKGKTIPFIEEIVENGLDILKIPCYLYGTNASSFKDKNGWYKYVSNDSIHVVSVEYIPNIFDLLVDDGVKIIRYKN